MNDIKGVAHFIIPVSDMERSKRFYTETVGLKHLATISSGNMAFFDAAGTCIILVKATRRSIVTSKAPMASSTPLWSTRTAIGRLSNICGRMASSFLRRDRQGRVVNGPCAYSRDPDGTCLEYIVPTSYSGAKEV
jgi:catechol-2,3-dioxygenase